MAIVIAKIVIAYLLGSLSGSLLLGRLRGIDIRGHGSGNAGGTNALRVAGWRFALGVIVIDVGKGALAAWLGAYSVAGQALDSLALAAACTIAAAIGHCSPVFFGFRGGKGAGTLVGGILVVAPWFATVMFIVWVAVIALTRYVGLATVLAATAMPLSVAVAFALGWPQPIAMIAFSIAVFALILYTHRGNLARLRCGEEPRLGRRVPASRV
ncbi:MAG: glycerol-3-phosphate 1-O-acyltransferase PlsY [Dokdonella sp.]